MWHFHYGEKVNFGMEVPFMSSDLIDWIEATFPNSNSKPQSLHTSSATSTSTHHYASYSAFHTPHSSTHLVWRINSNIRPHTVEILEVSPNGHIPCLGLRIIFPGSLFPFAYICINKTNCAHSTAPYLLYALQTDGTAYMVQLKNISHYYTCSHVFTPRDEFLAFNVQISPQYSSPITAATAISDCLVVGRKDGSLTCFRLSDWNADAPFQIHELIKGGGISCQKKRKSRKKPTYSVEELVISKVNGRNVLFALNWYGKLLIWDISVWAKLRSIYLEGLPTAGYIVSRLSVGSVDVHPCLIRVVFLLTAPCSPKKRIHVDHFYLEVGERRFLDRLIRPKKESLLRFGLSESKVIDVKPSSNKVWVLQEDGLWELNLYRRFRNRYSLHEAFVSKQLFQDSRHLSSSPFYCGSWPLFSSEKHRIGLISSILLHRLLQPGVCCLSILRSTFAKYYNKHWTDDEFSALTTEGLRREILSVIRQTVLAKCSQFVDQAVTARLTLVSNSWKDFCFQYVKCWKYESAPLSLFVDSQSGAVGLIRQNNVSMFRSYGDSELLMHCTQFEKIEPYRFNKPRRDDLESTILFKMLDCVRILNKQLRPEILSKIFIELVGVALPKPTENELPFLFEVIKCGYSTSASDLCASFGANFVWHKGCRGRVIEGLSDGQLSMVESVNGLLIMAENWSIILSALKRYMSFLVPQKLKPSIRKFDSNSGIFNINIPAIVVQATSQVAGFMLECALSIFLFLSFLLMVSDQVKLLPDDISVIQLELIPMVNNIISEWLIIHLFTTTPSISLSKEDNSNLMLSSLRIDESGRQRSWTKKFGSFDFTLAFVMLIDAHEGCSSWLSTSLPSLNEFTNLIRHFISWMHRKSAEKPLYGIENTTELTKSLLRNGQYNAVEIMLMIIDAHSRRNKLFESYVPGDDQLLQNLLNCFLLAQPDFEHVNLGKTIRST